MDWMRSFGGAWYYGDIQKRKKKYSVATGTDRKDIKKMNRHLNEL